MKIFFPQKVIIDEKDNESKFHEHFYKFSKKIKI